MKDPWRGLLEGGFCNNKRPAPKRGCPTRRLALTQEAQQKSQDTTSLMMHLDNIDNQM